MSPVNDAYFSTHKRGDGLRVPSFGVGPDAYRTFYDKEPTDRDS